jgi:broad specificity phosphatase PhoE
MTLHLIYETHSITRDNEAGIATGWLPGELSTQGRLLAKELGQRRSGSTDVVFTSDLARAVETAEIAFAGTRIPLIQDERLRECNYGLLNGKSVDQIAVERARRIDTPFPGGQSYRDVVAQTRSFLRDLAADSAGWDGKTVVVIAHSANRWALDHLFNGVPLEALVDAPFAWQEGWHYALQPGAFKLEDGEDQHDDGDHQ